MCCNGNDAHDEFLLPLIYHMTDDSFEFVLYYDFCVSYSKIDVSLHIESRKPLLSNKLLILNKSDVPEGVVCSISNNHMYKEYYGKQA